MKNLTTLYRSTFLMLLAFLYSFACVAQLQEIESSKIDWTTVGEIKWLANTKASLKYFVSSNDSIYDLNLQDDEKLMNSREMTVRKYFSIKYSGVDNTTGKLYELLISFFRGQNQKDKKLVKIFKLGDEMVHIQHYPKLMGAAIMFSTKENHIVFTENELKKLFGK
ncbi:MAG: hypothetical protein ABIO60_00830 [Aquaticitalea sp.]